LTPKGFVASGLDDWLAHQASVHPRAIDLGLERLREVLARLRWRRPEVPIITVAGTNGKGSVVATCAAILTAADYRVGTFTSPHLRDYRERIQIGNRRVLATELVAAFERIEAARGEIGLTFFEYNTLAALLVFEQARLDAWILEVGMGGRLDAVNVVDPDVAVVVSIGFDHQEFLGSTLEAIGREKAGIFRAGRPAVLGSDSLPPVVAATAQQLGAVLKRLGVEFSHSRELSGAGGASDAGAPGRWRYRGPRWELPQLPAPALRGETQYDNAATAIAAVEELGGDLEVSAAAIARGLEAVRLVARFQVVADPAGRAPTWILDVAHNPAAARVLASNLRALPTRGRTLAVCGILSDKDAAGIVGELVHGIDAWSFVSLPGERGGSGAALAARVAPAVGAAASVFDGVAAACAAALAAADAHDRIVVFGSFHTVGPALDWLEESGILAPEPRGDERTAA
jgi:dihydrofolate synthase/folylpolyglutamate synthase